MSTSAQQKSESREANPPHVICQEFIWPVDDESLPVVNRSAIYDNFISRYIAKGYALDSIETRLFKGKSGWRGHAIVRLSK